MSVFQIKTLLNRFTVLAVIIFFFAITKLSAAPIDSLQVLKIAGQDERAIIKTHDGKMQIIRPGDVVDADTGLRVVEIAEGRVVFEEKKDDQKETVIVRLVDGKQRVERIKKAPEKQPALYAPQLQQQQKQNEKNKSVKHDGRKRRERTQSKIK